MIKEAIEKIIAMSPVESLKFGGQEYTTKTLFPVRPHEPNKRRALSLSTLSGIVEWAESRDAADDFIVHIEDYNSVRVFSEQESYYKERDQYLHSTCAGSDFNFDRFVGIEQFVIDTSSKFVMTDELKNVIKTVSSIRQSEVVTVEDDGISQAVTASTNMNRIEQVQVSPFVKLKPFRTFREIEQPDSRFLLRMKQHKDSLPTVALFVADNSEWKIEAMKSVKSYLQKNFGSELGFDILM